MAFDLLIKHDLLMQCDAAKVLLTFVMFVNNGYKLTSNSVMNIEI